MQTMLPILHDQVIIHGEKAIVWTQFPAEQVYVAVTLVEANFNARVFHAGLSVHECSVVCTHQAVHTRSNLMLRVDLQLRF